MPFSRTSRLFLLIFLWSGLAFSQHYPGKLYSAAKELPNNSVRSSLVDSNNVLWIGTENGVIRKENDVLKYFFEEDGLALNSCWAIAEDKNKNLWFGSYGEGISIYDGTSFKVISEKDGLVHNEITELFPHGKFMYVGTSDGVSMVDINTFEVFSLDVPKDDQLFRITGFFEYGKEIYLPSYRSGIFKIVYETTRPILVKVNDHRFIYSVFIDNESIFSSNKGFFTKSSLADYVKEKDPPPLEQLGTSIIWDYVKTGDNRIYVAAWGIYDTNGGIYEVVNEQLVSRASEFNITSKEVISLAYDPNFEKLYVGTRDAGLFEIALNPQIKFRQIEERKVLGFARTKTTSAVLFHDGILLKEAENDHNISLLQLKEWQENYILNSKLPLPKHRDDFYELDYTTRAGEITFYDLKVFGNTYWVNTNIGLFAIKESGKLHRYLPLHTEEINFTATGDLIETNPYGGVRIYSDPVAFKYTYYKKEDPQTPTMVVSSMQKGDKTYFLSVFSGLYVWEKNRFRSYFQEDVWKEKKLKHITVLENDLAISNEFGDVFIVNDQASFRVKKKIPRAKIRGNTISFLKPYGGTLIIGTEKGLTLYKDDRYIFLDKEQGLEQPLWSAEMVQNTLSIGSNNGYYMVDLEAVCKTKALVDQIHLKEIFINNNAFSPEPTAGKTPVRLAHHENSVLLKFSTNAHPYPHKLKYQYRLHSKDNWSLPTSGSEIFLPSLPPENYEVDVKVLDESTGFTYTQPLLSFAILPPFWKTWWFALLMISLLLLAVYSIYSFQIRQNQKFEAQKGLIQKRFEETKMEALLAQMNPHFIFNAMNSIQYYIMDRDTDKATVFLGDFAKLIRLNLDHCTKPTILLTEEIEYLQSYVRIENTRFDHTVKILFETDPKIDPYEVEVPTMILQTFVENVFVHAFPTGITNPTLKISFKLLPENVLQCKIEDNGIGFSNPSTNSLHESRGVNLVKERLALLGYEVEEALQLISAKNTGTTVILRLQV